MKQILWIAVFLLGIAGCAAEQKPDVEQTSRIVSSEMRMIETIDGTYTDISAVGLQQMLEENDFPLINVHIPYVGEITDTDAFVPFNEIGVNVSQLPQDLDAPIVLYCLGGGMSTSAAKDLVALGYTNVFNLKGGMNAWQRAGFKLSSR